MNLNDQLRGALRRESPPDDFAAKVLARAAVKTSNTQWWRRPVTLALAAGLLLAALIPPAMSEYQRRQTEQARQAAVDLGNALAITGVQLRQVSEKIQHNLRHKI